MVARRDREPGYRSLQQDRYACLHNVARVEITHFTSIGQTKPVHVYQLIAENTVESKVGDGDPCHARVPTASS
jgi:hypothetical protein